MRLRKVRQPSKKQAIILIIALSFFIGIVLGAVSGALMEGDGVQRLSAAIENHFRTFGRNGGDAGEAFREGFFKYGKFIVIIWLLSFAPSYACMISVAFIIAARGAGYGFTGALILRTLTGGTAVGVILLNLPQFLLSSAACFLMSFISVNLSLKSSANAISLGMKEYFIALLAGLCPAVLAAGADALLFCFYPVEYFFAFLNH